MSGVTKMQIGVDSFGAVISDPATGLKVSALQRMDNLLDEIVLADQVGLDVFGIGEHHRSEFVDSAPPVILGAAATRTKNIRLTSAVTVLSAADPVRIFQEFATLDLISHGRAEIVAGRGSSIEAFPLFGFDLETTTTRSTQKSSIFSSVSARTLMFTGRKNREFRIQQEHLLESAQDAARPRKHGQGSDARRRTAMRTK
jgi:alkanesulfonate monooxygenase SsuD/methylene tetrahydromethanopterin reductase-like flavin-dependent oxidoreductase (luciferase family)